MSYNYSRGGTSRCIHHKSKSRVGGSWFFGRRAPHLSEKEGRKLHVIRRASLKKGNWGLRLKGCFKINKRDAAGSSKKGALATDVNDPNRKPPCSTGCKFQRAEKRENRLSLGSNKTNSNLSHSGHNHRLAEYGFDNESYQRVRDAVSLFRKYCDQLSKDKQRHDGQIKVGRIDRHAANLVKEKNMYVHPGVKFIGRVPGVEIGEQFIYRTELTIVGVHCPLRAGIDYTSENGEPVAISVVASKHYTDELKNPDELIYVGEGGMASRKKKPEDQKLVRGNLALKNNLRTRTPVRVILTVGVGGIKTKTFRYVYDGLYKVENFEKVRAPRGQMVYHFLLKRSPDQGYLRPCKMKF